jgi:hypothetical protein
MDQEKIAAAVLAACVKATDQLGHDRIKSISWFGRHHREISAKAA